jgi:lycopene beta-cyclase
VIDARGNPGLPAMAGGWQKFAGRMLRTRQPHGLTRPVVMDATVEQIDGYRFVYCLPFAADRVFVEDTYYSDSPALDLPRLHGHITAYAAAAGWDIAEVLGEEAGVLPVIARGDFDTFWPERAPGASAPARAGAHAALVHPLTSYSLPDAVRLARHIAALPDLSGPALAQATRAYAAHEWRARGFYRMLSRMLFGAAAPGERRRVLERFYTLPQPLIERFYAARSTRADQVRVLAGRPPVRLGAALASLTGGGRPLASLANAPVAQGHVALEVGR